MKLIWLLFSCSGSIWVAWFRSEIINGSVNNFWSTKPKQRYSWFVNKLLKLENEAYKWIKVKIGSGNVVEVWTDNWSPYGKLLDYLSPRSFKHYGSSLKCITLRYLHGRGLEHKTGSFRQATVYPDIPNFN